ncbi:hypothetical protein CC80DRAFT_509010 [Byssothecium circinans]|uniref:Uncharacterized protein n=1 Tax=Byssothecium circinans TaxID=147558 RepID=A0A6A5TG23_9PLEO|nr:hypothetical protein CC80DRAFT_509010 [Byssothecium circinans]
MFTAVIEDLIAKAKKESKKGKHAYVEDEGSSPVDAPMTGIDIAKDEGTKPKTKDRKAKEKKSRHSSGSKGDPKIQIVGSDEDNEFNLNAGSGKAEKRKARGRDGRKVKKSKKA